MPPLVDEFVSAEFLSALRMSAGAFCHSVGRNYNSVVADETQIP